MAHQNRLEAKCRLCLQEVTNFNYTVNNLTIKSFLQENYEDAPAFQNEEDNKFSKNVCNSCYQKISNYQATAHKHKEKHRRVKPDKKPAFDKPLPPYNFPTENDFKHSDNCKVCGNEEAGEGSTKTPQVETPQVLASPGSYKRKDTSPIEMPKTKRLNIRRPGTGRKTLFIDKMEEEDEDDPEAEMHIVSTFGTKISSEREIVKEENINDKSVASVFNCTICGKLPRIIKHLDSCGHMFCETCIYEWKKV